MEQIQKTQTKTISPKTVKPSYLILVALVIFVLALTGVYFFGREKIKQTIFAKQGIVGNSGFQTTAANTGDSESAEDDLRLESQVPIQLIEAEANFSSQIIKAAKTGKKVSSRSEPYDYDGPCAFVNAVLTPLPGDSLKVTVNKNFCLPASYVANDLVDISVTGIRKLKSSMLIRQVVVEDMTNMISEIKSLGMDLSAISCYRSYDVQTTIYNRYVNTIGRTAADKISARPGHSEHQLGTACDFGSKENKDGLGISFASTNVGKWLIANGSRFGFKMSYPSGQSAITGYSFEPWHWRYVGK